MSIVEKALESSSQLTFNELSELAGYSEEERKWAKIFWSSSFNDGWIYVSKEMLVEWFGYSRNAKGLTGKFIKTLTNNFSLNDDYKIIDRNHDLVKHYEKFFTPLRRGGKKKIGVVVV